MKIKVSVAEPVKQADGRWTLECREEYQDIPDLGRAEVMCNMCGCREYPECKKQCDIYVRKTLASVKKDA